MFKKIGRTDRVVSDLEKLIAINPNKIEYYSSLAVQYAELGQNKKSEEVISRLLGVDPELDKKINDFIEKIYSGGLIKR